MALIDDHPNPFEGKGGRGERIRTSGPCLPKTVLYQAELHSDRGAANTPARGLWQEPPPYFCRVFSRRRIDRSSGPMRRLVPVSSRVRVRRTGVFSEALLRPSRRTM